MPEKPLFCLGEAWVELGADTVPELAETFRVSVGGWGAAFCRAYVRAGGHAALLSQLGADPFGRKAAAQLAADGIDCTHLCFTDAGPGGIGDIVLAVERLAHGSYRWSSPARGSFSPTAPLPPSCCMRRNSWMPPPCGAPSPSAFPPAACWTPPPG